MPRGTWEATEGGGLRIESESIKQQPRGFLFQLYIYIYINIIIIWYSYYIIVILHDVERQESSQTDSRQKAHEVRAA